MPQTNRELQVTSVSYHRWTENHAQVTKIPEVNREPQVNNLPQINREPQVTKLPQVNREPQVTKIPQVNREQVNREQQ